MTHTAFRTHSLEIKQENRMKKITRRRGFTLPEILVTVTVIAVLAAAVVPAVTQYVNKGNTPASQQDVQQLQNAVTGFTADVRHYPGDLLQLTAQIINDATACDSLDCDGAATAVHYSVVEAGRWKGPYTSAAISNPGGMFTSNGLLFTIGRKITLSNGWLTVPITAPASGTGAVICQAVLALNKSLDASQTLGSEPTDGIVIWDNGGSGTVCDGNNTSGVVANFKLRLAPAN